MIGFQDLNESCVGQGQVFDMNECAIIMGFIGLFIVIFTMISACCVCNIPTESQHVSIGHTLSESKKSNGKKQTCLFIVEFLLFFIFSIIGFVDYSSSSAECKESSVGQVVLAWSVIRIISGCCSCIQSAATCLTFVLD